MQASCKPNQQICDNFYRFNSKCYIGQFAKNLLGWPWLDSCTVNKYMIYSIIIML